MSRFIPVDAEKAAALEEKLSQQIFRSVKDFVEFYNSGLISKKHEDVKEITREITETFKDVKEKNSRLVFISEQEVALEETLETLKLWESLVKAKREVSEAVAQNTVPSQGQLLLDDTGLLNTIAEDEETGNITLTSVSNEKVVSRKDDIPAVARVIEPSTAFNEQLKGYMVPVQNILHLDDSFVLDIKELLPNT